MAPFLRYVAVFLADLLRGACPEGSAGLQETTGEECYEYGCGAKDHGDY
jgi:hypothetical protein